MRLKHIDIFIPTIVVMTVVMLPMLLLFGTETFFEYSDDFDVVSIKNVDFRHKSDIFTQIKEAVISGEQEKALEEINGEEEVKESRKNNGTSTDYSKISLDVKKFKETITSEEGVVKFFEAMGAGSAQVCGILGNMMTESGLDPAADNGSHWGITQWDSGRYASMKNWCSQNGYDSSTLDGQVRYTWIEMNNSYYQNSMQHLQRLTSVPAQAKVGAADNFWETSDVLEATKNYCVGYEVGISYGSASGVQGWEARAAFAQAIYDKYYGGNKNEKKKGD